MSKRAEEYHKEFDALYGSHEPNLTLSKAEKAALKAYPPTHSERKRHAKRVQSLSVDTRQSVRTIFQKGYEQAEKDLALTWEDIEKITDIHRDVLYDNPKRIMGARENYEDTLRKFNEWREKNRATKNN